MKDEVVSATSSCYNKGPAELVGTSINFWQAFLALDFDLSCDAAGQPS